MGHIINIRNGSAAGETAHGLDTAAYQKFLLDANYLSPVRFENYRISDLPPFFLKAEQELKTLLGQIPGRSGPIIVSPNEEISIEYLLMGHGKTHMNKGGRVTGWSTEALCHSWKKGGSIIQGGIELALEQAQRISLNSFYLRFVSDLPRALHHALLLVNDKQLRDHVSQILAKPIELETTIFEKPLHQELMDLALQNGFIPTPLLRAQYYGPLEGGPEDPKNVEDSGFVQNMRANVAVFGHMPEMITEAEKQVEALSHRKELLFSYKDDKGIGTETRADLVTRITRFYDAVNDGLLGKRALVVTSSGCFDASKAYFRYFGQRDKMVIENEPKQRGRELEVKLGSFNGVSCYLNDPKRLSPLFDKAAEEIRHLQSLSIDSLVRDGKGIVEPKLLKIGEEELPSELMEEFGLSKPKISDLLVGEKPVIVFGHGGQGKSILLADLAKRILALNEEGFGYNVPLIQNCEQINKGARQFILNGKTLYDYLISSSDIGNIPEQCVLESRFVFLLDDYHKLNPDFSGEMEKAVHKLNEAGHKIVLFSRLERPETLPPTVPGYDLFQIETPITGSRFEDFLSARLSAKENAEFRNYLEHFDSSVTGSYLTLAFLTMLFGKKGNDVLNYIRDKGVSQAIKDRRSLNSVQLYDALTDYLVGLDVERINNNGLSVVEVREETSRLKSRLGEKAAYQEELQQLAHRVPSEWSYMDHGFNALVDLDLRLQKELRGMSLLHAARKPDLTEGVDGFENDKVEYFYPDGEYYAFIHDAFREFFAAKHIFEQIKVNNFKPLIHKLSKKVFDFLVEMNPNRDRLYEWIYSTREMGAGKCGFLGGNSITLLSALGEDLRGKDFSGTDLTGAKLTDKNMEGMVLKNANLIGVDFSCSNLNKVNVKGIANLEDRLPDSVGCSVIDISPDDVYLLSNEGSIVRWNMKKGEIFRRKVASETMTLLLQKYDSEDLPYLLEKRIRFNLGHSKVAVHNAGKLSVFDLLNGVKIFETKTEGVYHIDFVHPRFAPAFSTGEYLGTFYGPRSFDIFDLKTGKDVLEDIKKKRALEIAQVTKKKISLVSSYGRELHEFSSLEGWAESVRKRVDPFKEENPSLKNSDGTLSVSMSRIYDESNARAKSICELTGYDGFMPLCFTSENKLLYVGSDSSKSHKRNIVLHDVATKKDQVLKEFNGGKFFLLKPDELVFVHHNKSRIGLWKFDKATDSLNEFYHFDKDTFAGVIRD